MTLCCVCLVNHVRDVPAARAAFLCVLQCVCLLVRLATCAYTMRRLTADYLYPKPACEIGSGFICRVQRFHDDMSGGDSLDTALRACTNITFLRVATVAASSSSRRSRHSFQMATLTPLDDVISQAIRRRGNWEGISSASDVAPVGSGGGTFIDIGDSPRPQTPDIHARVSQP